jgi:hypothetical protein
MKKIWNWLLGRKKQQKKVETVQPDNYYGTINKVRTSSIPTAGRTIPPPKTSAGYSRDDNWSNDISNPMNPLSPMYIGNTQDNSSHNHINDSHYSLPIDHSSQHNSYDSSSNYSSDSSSYDSGSSYDSSSSDSSSW